MEGNTYAEDTAKLASPHIARAAKRARREQIMYLVEAPQNELGGL